MSKYLFNKINEILARWNPLDVPHFIASDEYKSYVNDIVSQGKDFDKIRSELKRILVDQMGLTFSDDIPEHSLDLDNVAKEIFNVL
ncbi:MAG: hypothetical protein HF300_11185 [Ignavibacteria bacterium]|jgi:hypothetical protein|nr:hypothetical protein [Ignavibacteria bacterium]MCU7500542.1 hypothetical protein [Ignavibacteria bacterium]MCU7513115.1 hypothetical protein [Ignavibacteria bacterium]MCU7521590.1 hypothetical protein [Ignavibacteria bacterium]MCU7524794.1 hypothetical protein [Ignavibacteria bacterium]